MHFFYIYFYQMERQEWCVIFCCLRNRKNAAVLWPAAWVSTSHQLSQLSLLSSSETKGTSINLLYQLVEQTSQAFFYMLPSTSSLKGKAHPELTHSLWGTEKPSEIIFQAAEFHILCLSSASNSNCHDLLPLHQATLLAPSWRIGMEE